MNHSRMAPYKKKLLLIFYPHYQSSISEKHLQVFIFFRVCCSFLVSDGVFPRQVKLKLDSSYCSMNEKVYL